MERDSNEEDLGVEIEAVHRQEADEHVVERLVRVLHREVGRQAAHKGVELVVEAEDVRVMRGFEQLLEVVRHLADDARERVPEDAVRHGRRLVERPWVGCDARHEISVLKI